MKETLVVLLFALAVTRSYGPDPQGAGPRPRSRSPKEYESCGASLHCGTTSVPVGHVRSHVALCRRRLLRRGRPPRVHQGRSPTRPIAPTASRSVPTTPKKIALPPDVDCGVRSRARRGAREEGPCRARGARPASLPTRGARRQRVRETRSAGSQSSAPDRPRSASARRLGRPRPLPDQGPQRPGADKLTVTSPRPPSR